MKPFGDIKSFLFGLAFGVIVSLWFVWPWVKLGWAISNRNFWAGQ
jgi:hypothetical protein